jgi:hypothetical protein
MIARTTAGLPDLECSLARYYLLSLSAVLIHMYSIRALPPSRPSCLPLLCWMKIAILYYTNTNSYPKTPFQKGVHLSPTLKTVTFQYALSFAQNANTLTAQCCLKSHCPPTYFRWVALALSVTPRHGRQTIKFSSPQIHHTHYGLRAFLLLLIRQALFNHSLVPKHRTLHPKRHT